MAVPKKGGDFSCDANCPNWKSLGLCSHTVAVAEVNHNLATFSAARRKKKQPGNLTNFLTATMPWGRRVKVAVLLDQGNLHNLLHAGLK